MLCDTTLCRVFCKGLCFYDPLPHPEKRMILYRNVRLIWPLLTVITACARATTPELPTPTPTNTGVPPGMPSDPISRTPVIGSAASWTLTPDIQPHTYNSVSRVTLEHTGQPVSGPASAPPASATPGRDSMVITTRYSLALNRTDQSTLISGSIELFRIDAGNRTEALPLPMNFPTAFSGRIINGQTLVDPVGQPQGGLTMSSSCPNPWSIIAAGVRRSIFIVPPRISRGMTWSDSTSSTTCHGLIPVVLELSNIYKVIGEVDRNGTPALLIERTGNSSAAGQGSEGQHIVTVRGEGLAAGNFYIDRMSGVLLDVEDEQRMRLVITSSGRNQEFAQTARERITIAGR